MRILPNSNRVVVTAKTRRHHQPRKRSTTNASRTRGYTAGSKNQATGPCSICICLKHRTKRRVACLIRRLSRSCALCVVALGVAGLHFFSCFALPEPTHFLCAHSVNASMPRTNSSRHRAASKQIVNALPHATPSCTKLISNNHLRICRTVSKLINMVKAFTHGSR